MSSKDLITLRHSAAHLLGHAVSELFPETLLTIGPATKEGFFYDFLPKHNFKEEDLVLIEERMKQLAQENIPLEHTQISKEEARNIFKGNPFKLELIELIPADTVGLSRQGSFVDLCRGGHVASTGEIKHFKLLGISGAYWRADRNNQALQRISGTAFFSEKDLEEFGRIRNEIQTYDHRRLGKQLDLFSFHDEGVGFPFFHPKGKSVLIGMTEYMRKELIKEAYQEIQTPMILSDQLWHQSGHWNFYKDKMYFSRVEEEDMHYAVKPMNCPGAILIFKERPRSFRELPLRLSEFGLVHRYELSGVLHGLLRVRAFTIDDGHIFCTTSQIEQEILTTINLTYRVLKKFGFEEVKVALSTKPENAMGDEKLWEEATKALKGALNSAQIPYELQEGEGAFYGPKIEFKFIDALGREWQGATIQVDFCQPENFELSYIASGGSKERPVMIHRAIYGSLERFFAILLEHYKGNLPFWIAPVQVKILTITDAQQEYAHGVFEALQKKGIRVEMDHSSDQISAKIKAAQLEKIPWMLVIGKKEMENNTVTLRHRDGKQEFGLTLLHVIDKATELIESD
jgi:threonyl-tRNA synthetase